MYVEGYRFWLTCIHALVAGMWVQLALGGGQAMQLLLATLGLCSAGAAYVRWLQTGCHGAPVADARLRIHTMSSLRVAVTMCVITLSGTSCASPVPIALQL